MFRKRFIINNTLESLKKIRYTSITNEIVVPEDSAFDANILSNIYNGEGIITFDKDITIIGGWAFYNCDNLISVIIPDSVISIGRFAFGYCDNLTSITIPDSVTLIGQKAFCNCDSLTSVTIPASVTTISQEAFSLCDNLASIHCKSKIPPEIYTDAFAHNAFNRLIYVPAGSVSAYRRAWPDYKYDIVAE